MKPLDWFILVATILLIVVYGMWKSRGAKNIQSYLLSDKDLKWWTIGLSIMATQASAITFLSTPGQAFDDGMRFVQFYFGLPIALVIISIVAIPIYHRLNVYTAYEYLEGRFDLKTRTLGAILFLISRGLAAGMTIYAPAIILSAILGWNINLTCVGIGLIVILYTVSGGTKAVSYTQKQQMLVILLGMGLASIIMVMKFPADVSLMDAVHVAGKMGKLNAITVPSLSEFDPNDRYNLWSGLIGGTFLALSYFGTDQSQVQRYLGGKTIAESRIGLMFNAVFKVPMQFLILFVGILMFVFYQFNAAPMFFNDNEVARVQGTVYEAEYDQFAARYDSIFTAKRDKIRAMLEAREAGDKAALRQLQAEVNALNLAGRRVREAGITVLEKNNPGLDKNDLDQVFLTFVINNLPTGVVGLLIAVILSAAMSSTSAELNALATTSLIDIYKRIGHRPREDEYHYVKVSRWLTFIWGLLAILFALYADRLGNMIQAVNIIGSLFYGTILGIFIVAFFMKKITGHAVFFAALIAETIVVACWLLPQTGIEAFQVLDIGFLWFNLIGSMAVVLFSSLFHLMGINNAKTNETSV